MGVFRVEITRRVESLRDGVTTFEPAAFKSGILPLCAEIVRLCPRARPVSSGGRILVWTETVEQTKEVLRIMKLGDVPVITRCRELSQDWTRITNVDRGFEESDILSALAASHVQEVRREMVKRRVGDEVVSTPTNRVLLRFEGVPPGEVVLAGRSHKVVLHAGTPVFCFRCQRLGHLASSCSNERACRRCGGSSHLAAECKYSPRCVNCKGPHVSNSPGCPLRACEIERRKCLMESRLVQQLRASHPDASIGTVDFPPLDSRPTSGETAEAPVPTSDPSGPRKTYAAAARSLIVGSEEDPQIRVNLPGHTTIPKPRPRKRPLQKSNKTVRRTPRSSGKSAGAGALSSNLSTVANSVLGPLIKFLDVFCPEASQCLVRLVQALGPLLAMVGGLSGDVADV